MAYADPEVQRARDRERFRKRTRERIAAGLCPRCGERPPAPERSLCEPCADKRNRAGRARDARLRAEGRPRRDPVKSRAHERERTRRERGQRSALGLCIPLRRGAGRPRPRVLRAVPGEEEGRFILHLTILGEGGLGGRLSSREPSPRLLVGGFSGISYRQYVPSP